MEAAAAILAEVREGPEVAEGLLGRVAEALRAFGAPLEEAFARRVRARRLAVLGRYEEAARERAASSSLFERLGVAGPAIA